MTPSLLVGLSSELSLRQNLTALFADAFAGLGFERRFGDVTLSDRPDLAHYQCNGALGAAKANRKNPREVATQVLAAVQARFPAGVELSIAGPGFINLKFTDEGLTQLLQALARDSRLGIPVQKPGRKVVIDYGGPNVAKSMHVGHLRSSIIGDALSKIHRFAGDHVIGDNHLGDWGTPMGMILCELRREQPQLPYFDPALSEGYPAQSPVTMEDLERLYPVASKRFKEEPDFQAEALRATDELQKGRPGYRALWQHFVQTTIRGMNADFSRLGIQFDVWLGESFYEEKMPPMVERLKAGGHAVLSDGAWVVPLASEAEPETPPLILVKSGGGFLYHTSDLATVEHRAREFQADLCLYVVDKRQSLHFKQVFAAARKTEIAPASMTLLHTAFGTMNGPDGKPFKTRAGGVLKLKDLIESINAEARKRLSEMGLEKEYGADEIDEIARKVGIATLKYADLKNNRTADYVFDLERFAQFEGNTGPYLLYAAVRIQSILRKAEAQGFLPGPMIVPTTAAERSLYLELLKYPDVFQRALEAEEPHHFCDYGFALSQAFNFFYKECHILREEDAARRSSWLGLCRLTHATLIHALGLLGIDVPERM